MSIGDLLFRDSRVFAGSFALLAFVAAGIVFGWFQTFFAVNAMLAGMIFALCITVVFGYAERVNILLRIGLAGTAATVPLTTFAFGFAEAPFVWAFTIGRIALLFILVGAFWPAVWHRFHHQ